MNIHQEIKSEGIILRCLEYKEYERILTVFTHDSGVISLFAKNPSRRNFQFLSSTTPFCQAEFLYTRGRTDLFRLREVHCIEEHLFLRSHLKYLDTAGCIARALLSSQLPLKPASLLYTLTLSYLRRIPEFENPSPLLSSFYLKLLQYEGLLAAKEGCALCSSQKAPYYLFKGENVCSIHAPPQAISFSLEEWWLFLKLLYTRSFFQLRTLSLSPEFSLKLFQYFQERVKDCL